MSYVSISDRQRSWWRRKRFLPWSRSSATSCARLRPRIGSRLNAPSSRASVGAGGQSLQAFGHNGMCEHGWRWWCHRRDVVGLGRASLSSCAPIFSHTVLAVTFPSPRLRRRGSDGGEPNFLSIATLRPLGPSVVPTAWQQYQCRSSAGGEHHLENELFSSHEKYSYWIGVENRKVRQRLLLLRFDFFGSITASRSLSLRMSSSCRRL